MKVLLDVAPAIYFYIPALIIAAVILLVGVAVFFIVRAIKKNNAKKEIDQ